MNSTPSPDEQLRQTQKPTCNTYVGTAICPGGRPIPAQQAGGICSCCHDVTCKSRGKSFVLVAATHRCVSWGSPCFHRAG